VLRRVAGARRSFEDDAHVRRGRTFHFLFTREFCGLFLPLTELTFLLPAEKVKSVVALSRDSSSSSEKTSRSRRRCDKMMKISISCCFRGIR